MNAQTMNVQSMNVQSFGGLLQLSWQKVWMLHRGVLLDYAAVAAVTVAFLGGDQPIGFAIGLVIVGALLACSMGARVGGDQTLAGTWEFTLTRPVNRGRWFDANFLCGLLPVGALFLTFAVADLVGLSSRIGALLAEPLPDARYATGMAPAVYSFPIAFVLLVYAFTFQFAVRERAPANVLTHRIAGVFAAGLTVFVFMVGAAASLVFSQTARQSSWAQVDRSAQMLVSLPLSLPMLLVAAVAFWIGRASVVRREELGRGEPDSARSVEVGRSVVVVFAVIVLALGLLWLMSAAREPEGSNADPTTPTTTPTTTDGGR